VKEPLQTKFWTSRGKRGTERIITYQQRTEKKNKLETDWGKKGRRGTGPGPPARENAKTSGNIVNNFQAKEGDWPT